MRLQLEPVLQRFFGHWGTLVSGSPWRIISPMLVVLIAISFGIIPLEKQNDPAELWIADRGRIKDELSYYRDSFEELSPNLQALIVQPKKGDGKVNLLDPKALEEVVELQDWVMQYEYAHRIPGSKDETLEVSLGDICFKPVDKDDREPCFQYSVLDCFREGNVFTPGGKKNSAYSGVYSPARPSFSTFDFKEMFTEEFVREKCVQWYNLGTADTMFLGGITKGVNSKGETTVTDVEALRIVFGTKSEEKLLKDGVKKIIWTSKASTGASGLELCQDESDCADCYEEVGLADAAGAGCIPSPGAQSESCCTFMTELRDSPCLESLFQQDPSLANLGNLVFEGCGIPTVQLGGKCNNEELFLKQASKAEKSNTDAPEVCICLVDRESEECRAAATEFAGANVQYAPTFIAAQSGDVTALRELRDILQSPEVGCPAGDSLTPESETTLEEDSPPEVCICITERASPECQSAGQAFIAENPQYLSTFLGAASGNDTAVQEVAKILVEDVKCPVGGERRRKLLQMNDDDEAPLPVCACLKDTSSKECEDGGTAFVRNNPEYLDVFVAARSGNATASIEVASVIQDKGNCEQKKYSFAVEITNFRNEDLAWDLLHGWEKAWRRDVKEQAEKFKYIDVAWLTSSTVTDETAKAARGQIPLITAGYIMVGVYIVTYFMLDFENSIPSISIIPPGPLFAILGYLCVLLSVATTFGIIGIVSLSSIKTSPITLQIVPLLMVGLGVNDFFVIASYLKSSVLNNPTASLKKLMYITMAGGGTSITLSSLTNMAAFALGALSPIPAVQWFSIHMMIGVFIAYSVSITIIPAILTIAASRYLNGISNSCLPCLQKLKVGAPPPTNQTPAGASADGGMIAKLITLIVFVVFGFWLGMSIWGITRLELGLPASQIVPHGEETYRFLKPSEDHFQTFPIYMVYPGGKNLAKLETISDARAMEYDFTINAYKVDRTYKTTSWLNYYSEYVESKFCSNDICMDEIEWFWDGFASEEYGTEDICKGLAGGPKACKKACSQRCPQGPLKSKFRCSMGKDGKSCFCPYRPKLKERFFFENPEGHSGKPSYWADFLANSTGGSISKGLIDFDDSTKNQRNIYGIPSGFRSLTVVEDVDTIDEKVKHINSGRKIIDGGPIDDAFPFDSLVYGVGEQYKDLGVKATVAIAISLVVTLVVMMPLIVHWLAAVIVALCVLSAVVLTAGTGHWFGIGLNHSLYVSLVVTVGLSVEFCSHIARDFMLAEGSSSQRVQHALHSLGFAVFNGGITTLLGILPLSWAKYNYFQKYFFGLYAIVVVVGLFVGLFLMPAVLYWIGPKSRHAASKNHVGDENGMEMVGKGKVEAGP